MRLFYYRREVKRKEKIEATEDQLAGERDIIDEYWDCFNPDCVIRAFWKDKDTFVILLNDGHEQAEDRQKPLFKNGKPAGYEVKRERDWFYSQIVLSVTDAERFKYATEMV